MRLNAQARGGYFPIHDDVVRAWAGLLSADKPDKVIALDPCAGKGAALAALCDSLGVPQENRYAVELDADRAAECAGRIANTLGPADFFETGVSAKCFSLVWCNPPYDTEMGGGNRVEMSFLRRVTDLMVPGGVLGLAVPESVIESWQTLAYLRQWYDGLFAAAYLAEHRHHHEVIVTGRRRATINPDDSGPDYLPVGELSAHRAPVPVPAGHAPKRWLKIGPTESELADLIANSPLRLQPAACSLKPSIARPPLPLCVGHTALLLASGYIDGVVHPDGEPPHVIRGTVRKDTYLASAESTEDEKGQVKTKEVYKEKIKLAVRVVDQAGAIRNFE